MSYVEIRAIDYDESRELFTQQDTFTYKPERGWAWAHRACLWVLARIGCHNTYERLKHTRYLIPTDDVFGAIVAQIDAREAIAYRDATTVYMGPEDLQRIIGADVGRNYIEFHARGSLGVDGAVRVFGLNVKVIPWMRGILVV